MRPGLLELFQETYSELRPGTSLPELKIEFFAFANVNNTIRLRERDACWSAFQTCWKALRSRF